MGMTNNKAIIAITIIISQRNLNEEVGDITGSLFKQSIWINYLVRTYLEKLLNYKIHLQKSDL